jgi:hypothetical protein
MPKRLLKSLRMRMTTMTPGSEDEEADVKPVIDPELETKPNIQQVDEPSPAVKEKIDLEAGPHWEHIASIALIDALDSARHLMEAKRGDILVARIHREDWLPEIKAAEESGSSESPLVQHDTRHRRAVQVLESPSKKLADESPAEDSSELSTSSEEEFHTSDSEHSSEQESNTGYSQVTSTTSGLVPLKALFTLHARYEESRLAVWLDIPKASRGKMAAFMRGHNPPLPQTENDQNGEEEQEERSTHRYVGEVWDELGLLLLMSYDK